MSKKRDIGANVVPRSICRGNPRRPSAAMNCALDAQPLGRTFSKVTKQKYVPSRARPSDSLDSISDEESSKEKNIIRSHVRPNKNVNAYADIPSPRIPKMPHDPSKPAIMKHRDLPSVPLLNHVKIGSGRSKPVHALSRSFSTDSSAFSSSDEYIPFNKISRILTKTEMKEEPVRRSVKNEEISKTSIPRFNTSGQEMKKEIVVDIKKEMGVQMLKPQTSIVHKKEIKEEMNGINKGEVNSESSDEDEEEEMEDSIDTRLKWKKCRPAEELAMERQVKKYMKTEIKVEKECEIITID